MQEPLVLPPEVVRELDRYAIEELGLPGVVLMENAGRGAAEAVLRGLSRPERARVVVLLGRGNNAGDGYVLARHLDLAGVAVELVETASPERLSPDAAVFRAVLARAGFPLRDGSDAARIEEVARGLEGASCVVDALLGTGARGALREPIAGWVRWANARRAEGAEVVALDVPSGLDPASGSPAEPCLEADRTVTFAAAKTGLVAPGAARWVGRLEVVPIGIPPRVLERFRGGSG